MTVQILINRRIAADLTQEKLAQLAGMTKNQLSLVERGKRKLSFAESIEIAKALNVSADYLGGITNYNIPPASKRYNEIISSIMNLGPESLAKLEGFLAALK